MLCTFECQRMTACERCFFLAISEMALRPDYTIAYRDMSDGQDYQLETFCIDKSVHLQQWLGMYKIFSQFRKGHPEDLGKLVLLHEKCVHGNSGHEMPIRRMFEDSRGADEQLRCADFNICFPQHPTLSFLEVLFDDIDWTCMGSQVLYSSWISFSKNSSTDASIMFEVDKNLGSVRRVCNSQNSIEPCERLAKGAFQLINANSHLPFPSLQDIALPHVLRSEAMFARLPACWQKEHSEWRKILSHFPLQHSKMSICFGGKDKACRSNVIFLHLLKWLHFADLVLPHTPKMSQQREHSESPMEVQTDNVATTSAGKA